eukprot:636936_1
MDRFTLEIMLVSHWNACSGRLDLAYLGHEDLDEMVGCGAYTHMGAWLVHETSFAVHICGLIGLIARAFAHPLCKLIHSRSRTIQILYYRHHQDSFLCYCICEVYQENGKRRRDTQ